MNKLLDLIFILFVCVFKVQCGDIVNIPVGSPCEDEVGKNGTCVPSYRCLSLIKYSTGDYHQLFRSDPLICSYLGKEPLICCSDCELVANASLAVGYGTIYWKDGRNKGWDKCLEYFENLHYRGKSTKLGLIRGWDEKKKCHSGSLYAVSPAGGKPVRRGDYPHMVRINDVFKVLLGYGEDDESAQWLCGGSVISERFILTAAHCISSPQLGPVSYAATGLLKRSDPRKFWDIYKIKKIIPHPEYAPPSKYHDIALLETHKLIKFNMNTMPACLPYNVTNDTSAKATGWGALGHRRNLADNLEEVETQKFSNEQCASLYPVHRHLKSGYNSTTQMCYGDHEEVKDTCQGDSGGPLQVRTQKPSYIHTIIGVTSSGKDCGFAGNAGLYARVSYYVPWIESVVWP